MHLQPKVKSYLRLFIFKPSYLRYFIMSANTVLQKRTIKFRNKYIEYIYTYIFIHNKMVGKHIRNESNER